MNEFELLVKFIFYYYEKISKQENLKPEGMDDNFLDLMNTLNDEQKNKLQKFDFDAYDFAINYSKSTIKFFLTGLCPCLFDQVD